MTRREPTKLEFDPQIAFDPDELDYPFGPDFLKEFSVRLRSPLAAVRSNVQLLKEKVLKGNNELISETFFLSECSIDSISEFIENLEFLSGVSGAKIKRAPKPIVPGAIIKKAIEEIRHQFSGTDRILVNYTDDKVPVYLDRYLIGKVLVNLINNALKFSRDKVQVDVSASDGLLKIVVADTGIGIPDDQIKSIFKPFIRASNCRLISGMGLGLAIVAKVVEYYQGNVVVNTREGHGTEISVLIPSVEFQNNAQKGVNQILLSSKLKIHD